MRHRDRDGGRHAAARTRAAANSPAGFGTAAGFDDGPVRYEGHRARREFHPEDRADDGRAGASGRAQHDWL